MYFFSFFCYFSIEKVVVHLLANIKLGSIILRRLNVETIQFVRRVSGATTLNIMTLSIMTVSTTKNKMQLSALSFVMLSAFYAQCHK
jgi:hypothetical protein